MYTYKHVHDFCSAKNYSGPCTYMARETLLHYTPSPSNLLLYTQTVKLHMLSPCMGCLIPQVEFFCTHTCTHLNIYDKFD